MAARFWIVVDVEDFNNVGGTHKSLADAEDLAKRLAEKDGKAFFVAEVVSRWEVSKFAQREPLTPPAPRDGEFVEMPVGPFDRMFGGRKIMGLTE